jgi:fructose-bisphosphate aldolase class II
VIFDATNLTFEENIKVTKQCVEYARSVNPDIVVESELGFIGSSSKVLEGIPEGVKITEEFLTKPEEAKRFVLETGVDMIAPAVGNIHGMLKGGKDPALNIKRIKEIKEAVGIPMVLHGASGNSADDIRAAIAAGMNCVHINTEIRVAFRQALVKSLQENPDEVAPYKYMKEPVLAVQKVVEEKLKLFSNLM